MTTPPPDRASLVETLAREKCRRFYKADQLQTEAVRAEWPLLENCRWQGFIAEVEADLAAIEAAGGVVVPREPDGAMIGEACMDGLRVALGGLQIEDQVRAIFAAMVFSGPYGRAWDP